MSYKKEEEKLNHDEQQISDTNNEKLPEFDVHGTALNDIHSSIFES